MHVCVAVRGPAYLCPSWPPQPSRAFASTPRCAACVGTLCHPAWTSELEFGRGVPWCVCAPAHVPVLCPSAVTRCVDTRRDARLPVDILACVSSSGLLEPVGELLRCASLLVDATTSSSPGAAVAPPSAPGTSIYSLVCSCISFGACLCLSAEGCVWGLLFFCLLDTLLSLVAPVRTRSAAWWTACLPVSLRTSAWTKPVITQRYG